MTHGKRLENREALISQLSEIIAGEPRNHWIAVLEKADLPVGPVREFHDVNAIDQVRFYGSVVDIPAEEHVYKGAR